MTLRRGHWGWGRVRTQVWGLVVSQALRAWGKVQEPLAVGKQHFSPLLLSLQPTPGQEMLSTGERDPGAVPQSGPSQAPGDEETSPVAVVLQAQGS